MTDCRQQLTFDFHPRKAVVADFGGGLISSDAGLLPIRQLDQRLGWTEVVAGLRGPRHGRDVHRRVQQRPVDGWTD